MFLLLAACLAGVVGALPRRDLVFALGEGEDHWWRDGVIYQVYPRSFMDSDGNGVGDIPGILKKVDYFKDLGVSAVWLGPMYPSGGVDFGYDVINMTAIDPLFGSMQNLTELIKELHDRGIKVIMDIVPNHTSNKHKWFLSSCNSSDPDFDTYKDYYIWRTTKANNWVSVMGGSAWTYEENRQMFYLHNFFEGQPDLNYRNPAVVNDMMEIIKFWFTKGVDGFRMDAVSWLVEDFALRDEPLVQPVPPNCNTDSLDYGCFNHIYTTELQETYDMIRNYTTTLDATNYPDRVMFTESYNNDIQKIMKYYQYGVTFPMNMRIIQFLNRESTPQNWTFYLNEWLESYNALPPSDLSSPNWILGNHDQHRVSSRLWEEVGDALNMMLMVMKGTVITYNGEELVMVDGPVRWDQAQDQQGKNAGPSNYYQAGRDGERTPFQWNTDVSSGFSTNTRTWLPVNPEYVWNNQDKQNGDTNSHLNIYKKALKLKSHPTIKYGDIKISTANDNVLFIKRSYTASNGTVYPSVFFLMNLGENVEDISIKTLVPDVNDNLNVYVRSSNNVDLIPQDSVTSKSITLRPKAGVIVSDNALKF